MHTPLKKRPLLAVTQKDMIPTVKVRIEFLLDNFLQGILFIYLFYRNKEENFKNLKSSMRREEKESIHCKSQNWQHELHVHGEFLSHSWYEFPHTYAVEMEPRTKRTSFSIWINWVTSRTHLIQEWGLSRKRNIVVYQSMISTFF